MAEDELLQSFLSLNINDSEKDNAIKIQKCIRGYFSRKKYLPIILYTIKNYLLSKNIDFSKENDDGRINSCIDESKIIDLLTQKFGDRIKKPKIRMWYDILANDNLYGWIPINIKTTTTSTNDNTGNLAMCVFAYTNEKLDFNKTYNNGKMSKILSEKLKQKKYNYNYKKDYFFLVLNKNNINDIIINSTKGLSELTANINNLPFQVCWNKNRIFKYTYITECINKFIKCIQKPEPSWQEDFLKKMRLLKHI